MTKIYITRHALTNGIKSAHARVDGDMALVHGKGIFCGNDFHFDAESAIDRAEQMRTDKLKSLDKQIKKVSAINFEVAK